MEPTGSIPLHPFLVHFPIAAWLIGSLILLMALALKKQDWQALAWLLLGIGALTAIPTALTGQVEYARLARESHEVLSLHRTLGNVLPWLMCAIVLFKAHTHFSPRAFQLHPWLWCGVVCLVSTILLYAGLLGGRVVYGWGIGPP